MNILRSVDPKRADDILETHPDLKTALKEFPEGTESMQDNGQGGINSSTSSGGRANPQQDAEERLRGLARNRAAQALDALKEDPDKALSIAKTIPVPSFQADALGKIANSVGGKDLALRRASWANAFRCWTASRIRRTA